MGGDPTPSPTAVPSSEAEPHGAWLRSETWEAQAWEMTQAKMLCRPLIATCFPQRGTEAEEGC